MNAEKPLKISILGKNFTVVTDECDSDVYAAACIVEKTYQMRGVRGFVWPQYIDKIAVIITLQVAMELVKTRKMMQLCENLCTSLVDVIEHSL